MSNIFFEKVAMSCYQAWPTEVGVLQKIAIRILGIPPTSCDVEVCDCVSDNVVISIVPIYLQILYTILLFHILLVAYGIKSRLYSQ